MAMAKKRKRIILDSDEEEAESDEDAPLPEERVRSVACVVCRRERPSTDYFEKKGDSDGSDNDGGASSANTCKGCISALLGLKDLPIRWARGRASTPAAACARCGRRRSARALSDLERCAAREGGDRDDRLCLACLPTERLWEGLWAPRDGPVAWRLRRHGVEVFDCDPFLRSGDDDGDKFAPLPPSEDLVGTYNVIFLKWETEGTVGITSTDYGDVLLKRTVPGALHLATISVGDRHGSDSDSGSDREEHPSHEQLVGCITFDDIPFFEDQQGSGDVVCSHPHGNSIYFRFSEGFYMGEARLEGNGDDEGCSAAAVFLTNGFGAEGAAEVRSALEGLPHSSRLWGGSYGTEVVLRVVGERASFPWIPADGRDAAEAYARRMREELRQSAERDPDWSQSWLHRRAGLPAPVVGLVHDFLRVDFRPELEILPNDILLTFKFDEYPSSLRACVVVRRQSKESNNR